MVSIFQNFENIVVTGCHEEDQSVSPADILQYLSAIEPRVGITVTFPSQVLFALFQSVKEARRLDASHVGLVKLILNRVSPQSLSRVEYEYLAHVLCGMISPEPSCAYGGDTEPSQQALRDQEQEDGVEYVSQILDHLLGAYQTTLAIDRNALVSMPPVYQSDKMLTLGYYHCLFLLTLSTRKPCLPVITRLIKHHEAAELLSRIEVLGNGDDSSGPLHEWLGILYQTIEGCNTVDDLIQYFNKKTAGLRPQASDSDAYAHTSHVPEDPITLLYQAQPSNVIATLLQSSDGFTACSATAAKPWIIATNMATIQKAVASLGAAESRAQHGDLLSFYQTVLVTPDYFPPTISLSSSSQYDADTKAVFTLMQSMFHLIDTTYSAPLVLTDFSYHKLHLQHAPLMHSSSFEPNDDLHGARCFASAISQHPRQNEACHTPSLDSILDTIESFSPWHDSQRFTSTITRIILGTASDRPPQPVYLKKPSDSYYTRLACIHTDLALTLTNSSHPHVHNYTTSGCNPILTQDMILTVLNRIYPLEAGHDILAFPLEMLPSLQHTQVHPLLLLILRSTCYAHPGTGSDNYLTFICRLHLYLLYSSAKHPSGSSSERGFDPKSETHQALSYVLFDMFVCDALSPHHHGNHLVQLFTLYYSTKQLGLISHVFSLFSHYNLSLSTHLVQKVCLFHRTMRFIHDSLLLHHGPPPLNALEKEPDDVFDAATCDLLDKTLGVRTQSSSLCRWICLHVSPSTHAANIHNWFHPQHHAMLMEMLHKWHNAGIPSLFPLLLSLIPFCLPAPLPNTKLGAAMVTQGVTTPQSYSIPDALYRLMPHWLPRELMVGSQHQVSYSIFLLHLALVAEYISSKGYEPQPSFFANIRSLFTSSPPPGITSSYEPQIVDCVQAIGGLPLAAQDNNQSLLHQLRRIVSSWASSLSSTNAAPRGGGFLIPDDLFHSSVSDTLTPYLLVGYLFQDVPIHEITMDWHASLGAYSYAVGPKYADELGRVRSNRSGARSASIMTPTTTSSMVQDRRMLYLYTPLTSSLLLTILSVILKHTRPATGWWSEDPMEKDEHHHTILPIDQTHHYYKCIHLMKLFNTFFYPLFDLRRETMTSLLSAITIHAPLTDFTPSHQLPIPIYLPLHCLFNRLFQIDHEQWQAMGPNSDGDSLVQNTAHAIRILSFIEGHPEWNMCVRISIHEEMAHTWHALFHIITSGTSLELSADQLLSLLTYVVPRVERQRTASTRRMYYQYLPHVASSLLTNPVLLSQVLRPPHAEYALLSLLLIHSYRLLPLFQNSNEPGQGRSLKTMQLLDNYMTSLVQHRPVLGDSKQDASHNSMMPCAPRHTTMGITDHHVTILHLNLMLTQRLTNFLLLFVHPITFCGLHQWNKDSLRFFTMWFEHLFQCSLQAPEAALEVLFSELNDALYSFSHDEGHLAGHSQQYGQPNSYPLFVTQTFDILHDLAALSPFTSIPGVQSLLSGGSPARQSGGMHEVACQLLSPSSVPRYTDEIDLVKRLFRNMYLCLHGEGAAQQIKLTQPSVHSSQPLLRAAFISSNHLRIPYEHYLLSIVTSPWLSYDYHTTHIILSLLYQLPKASIPVDFLLAFFMSISLSPAIIHSSFRQHQRSSSDNGPATSLIAIPLLYTSQHYSQTWLLSEYYSRYYLSVTDPTCLPIRSTDITPYTVLLVKVILTQLSPDAQHLLASYLDIYTLLIGGLVLQNLQISPSGLSLIYFLLSIGVPVLRWSPAAHVDNLNNYLLKSSSTMQHPFSAPQPQEDHEIQPPDPPCPLVQAFTHWGSVLCPYLSLSERCTRFVGVLLFYHRFGASYTAPDIYRSLVYRMAEHKYTRDGLLQRMESIDTKDNTIPPDVEELFWAHLQNSWFMLGRLNDAIAQIEHRYTDIPLCTDSPPTSSNRFTYSYLFHSVMDSLANHPSNTVLMSLFTHDDLSLWRDQHKPRSLSITMQEALHRLQTELTDSMSIPTPAECLHSEHHSLLRFQNRNHCWKVDDSTLRIGHSTSFYDYISQRALQADMSGNTNQVTTSGCAVIDINAYHADPNVDPIFLPLTHFTRLSNYPRFYRPGNGLYINEPVIARPFTASDYTRFQKQPTPNEFIGNTGPFWHILNTVYAPTIDDITALLVGVTMDTSGSNCEPQQMLISSTMPLRDNHHHHCTFHSTNDEGDSIDTGPYFDSDTFVASQQFYFAPIDLYNYNIHGENYLMHAILRRWDPQILFFLVNLYGLEHVCQYRDHSGYSAVDYMLLTNMMDHAPSLVRTVLDYLQSHPTPKAST